MTIPKSLFLKRKRHCFKKYSEKNRLSKNLKITPKDQNYFKKFEMYLLKVKCNEALQARIQKTFQNNLTTIHIKPKKLNLKDIELFGKLNGGGLSAFCCEFEYRFFFLVLSQEYIIDKIS